MGGLLLKKDKPGKPKYLTELKPLSDFEEIPIPAYQFSIEIGSVTAALFQACKNLEVTREVEKLTEGGLNAYTYEFAGHVSFGHVTLETGLTTSDFFWKWMTDGQLDGWIHPLDFSLVQRRPSPGTFTEVRKWDFFNAFPVKWKISDLSVDDSQKIAIESLELSFDYFEAGKIE
jgi:phage tail-like protein